MSKHLFFQYGYNGFMNGTAKNHIPPFNNNAIDSIELAIGSELYNKSMYSKVVESDKAYPLKSIFGIGRAIARMYASEKHTLKNRGGYGFDEDGIFWADYYDSSGTIYTKELENDEDGDLKDTARIIIRIDTKGDMKAVTVNQFGKMGQYIIQTATGQKDVHSASASIFALYGYIVGKYRDDLNTASLTDRMLVESYLQIVNNDFSFLEELVIAENDVYTLFSRSNTVKRKLGFSIIDPDDYTNAMVPLLSESEVPKKFVNFWGDSAILKGRTEVFDMKAKEKKKLKNANVRALVESGIYNLQMELSDNQRLLVPCFDEFIPSIEVLETAEEIKLSMDDSIACRNILWTGETGTGKTTAAKILSQLLGLPYYSMCGSSDKLTNDLFETCLPNNNQISIEKYKEKVEAFPDSACVLIDPAGAYQLLTGLKKEDATEKDVYDAEEEIRFSMLKNTSEFMYVDSPLVQAYQNGGVFELQEANALKSSILKAFNEALDDQNILHLPTGRVIKRHKNCIIVVTANCGSGYEGVSDFSNDFVSRFHQANIFSLPEEKEMVDRVIERSGYTDKSTIKKMLKVMKAIQKVLLETKGDYGACSARAVYNWARRTKHCNDPYKSALSTIVSISTQDPEVRIEVIHALETEFMAKV